MSFKFEMSKDFSAAKEIERRIKRIELANSYAKKTTLIHQNNKKISILKSELKRVIYQHNKYDLFQVLEKELSIRLTSILDDGFSRLAETGRI